MNLAVKNPYQTIGVFICIIRSNLEKVMIISYTINRIKIFAVVKNYFYGGNYEEEKE